MNSVSLLQLVTRYNGFGPILVTLQPARRGQSNALQSPTFCSANRRLYYGCLARALCSEQYTSCTMGISVWKAAPPGKPTCTWVGDTWKRCIDHGTSWLIDLPQSDVSHVFWYVLVQSDQAHSCLLYGPSPTSFSLWLKLCVRHAFSSEPNSASEYSGSSPSIHGKGLTGMRAEYAVQKHKSHRHIKMALSARSFNNDFQTSFSFYSRSQSFQEREIFVPNFENL